MEPILTIAIPTYKHPQDFERLLQTIIPQAKRPEVEILIRDDSPDSETETIVKKYENQLPLRYVHGEKIGLDGAVIFLIEEAKGKYVWWFGDNDELRPGAIDRVLKVIQENPDISYIHANFQLAGWDHPNYADPSGLYDRNYIIQKFTNTLGFITASIMKREAVLSALEPSKEFMKTAFVNLYITLAALTDREKSYFLNEATITCNPTPTGEYFYDGFPTFAVHFFRIFHKFRNKFEPRAFKNALAKNFGNIWRGILVARGRGDTTGLGSPTPKLPTIIKLYWNYPEFWIAWPLLLLPRFVDKWLYKLYQTFFSQRRLRILKHNA